MAVLNAEEIYQKVESLVRPLIEASGSELIELKIGGHPTDWLIQIFADKPIGGISIEECSRLNKAVAEAIEQGAFLPAENFALEVSSPGLDRPLKSYKDFLRVEGMEVHLWLKEAIEGKKEIKGVLAKVSDSALILDLNRVKQAAVPLNNVIKGLLIF